MSARAISPSFAEGVKGSGRAGDSGKAVDTWKMKRMARQLRIEYAGAAYDVIVRGI